MLYTKEDFVKAKKNAVTARLILLALVIVTFLCGLIPMLVNRNVWISTFVSLGAALVTLFIYGSALAPVLAYRRFIFTVEENPRRDFEGIYAGQGDESMREGVLFRRVMFKEDIDAEPRNCYLDSSLSIQPLEEGKVYKITHTGNSILAIETPAGV